ncbi:Syntaxin-5 [Smittium mucronatum]|uniref:Syntaxin-5 n=1 Tax=Smittium mucronatum TaxID=133383 RepID=A0A1R0H357_9FUNG|nr:Syntaxin-5 [Smittium mucronatum]
MSRIRDQRDRTVEFRTIVAALKKRANTKKGFEGGSIVPKKTITTNDQNSFFSKKAKEIAQNIHDTTVVLEDLAKMARKRTIFEDSSGDINDLTATVKMNIAKINEQIMELQSSVHSKKNGGKQVEQHNNNVVILLQSKLATTSNSFKSVLEIRRENLQESSSRRDKLLVGQLPPSVEQSGAQSYLSKRAARVYNSPNLQEDNSSEYTALTLPTFGQDAMQQQQMLIQEQSGYQQSRNEAVKAIESTISELGSIFQQLATMVSEQRDVVQRIDMQIEDVHTNISGAHSELLTYYQNISTNRWLYIKPLSSSLPSPPSIDY